MTPRSERPHATVRSEHQTFAYRLHEIEQNAASLLYKNQEPTVKNLIRGIWRDPHGASRLKKKLLVLTTAFHKAREDGETGPWAPTKAIQGAMFFLFDCLKASEPASKWYALEKIERPEFVINIVRLDIPTHSKYLRAADRDSVPARANEDLDMLLLQQPQLPADYVAVEAEKYGFGEVELDECAPATEAQRSYPGKAAHRNDKNKGATQRKRAAKWNRLAASNSEDADAEVAEPPRKRTRSQTKAAASSSKAKGKAPARPTTTRGRRNKKVVTPPPVEDDEEPSLSPEPEERIDPPAAIRSLARIRLEWDQRPRDENGERIPYVETEYEAREREHREFLARGPAPIYGLNGDLVGMTTPPPDDDDEQELAAQAEEQERAEREEHEMLRIKEEVRAHNERLMLEGGDDDDAMEWPTAGGSGSQPAWTPLKTTGVDDDGEDEVEDEEEEEEEEMAEDPAPAPPPQAPAALPRRFPTPEWLAEGPSGSRPAV
ncbi:hypothetical protein GGF50DRAFT_67781 [Schizophyllum commune]